MLWMQRLLVLLVSMQTCFADTAGAAAVALSAGDLSALYERRDDTTTPLTGVILNLGYSGFEGYHALIDFDNVDAVQPLPGDTVVTLLNGEIANTWNVTIEWNVFDTPVHRTKMGFLRPARHHLAVVLVDGSDSTLAGGAAFFFTAQPTVVGFSDENVELAPVFPVLWIAWPISGTVATVGSTQDVWVQAGPALLDKLGDNDVNEWELRTQDGFVVQTRKRMSQDYGYYANIVVNATTVWPPRVISDHEHFVNVSLIASYKQHDSASVNISVSPALPLSLPLVSVLRDSISVEVGMSIDYRLPQHMNAGSTLCVYVNGVWHDELMVQMQSLDGQLIIFIEPSQHIPDIRLLLLHPDGVLAAAAHASKDLPEEQYAQLYHRILKTKATAPPPTPALAPIANYTRSPDDLRAGSMSDGLYGEFGTLGDGHSDGAKFDDARVEITNPAFGQTLHTDELNCWVRIEGSFIVGKHGTLFLKMDTAKGSKISGLLTTSDDGAQWGGALLSRIHPGRHRLISRLLDWNNNTVEEDQSIFYIGAPTGWMENNVWLEGGGKSSCAVEDIGSTASTNSGHNYSQCSFDIVVRNVATTPTTSTTVVKDEVPFGSKHTFIVNLGGNDAAAMVGATVGEGAFDANTNVTRYPVSYIASELGTFNMEIHLEYVDGQGLSNIPHKVYASYMHVHIPGSPFVVNVTAASQSDDPRSHDTIDDDSKDEDAICSFYTQRAIHRKSLPLCSGLRNEVSGRWVANQLCQQFAGLCDEVVLRETQAIVNNVELTLNFTWVPHSCRMRTIDQELLFQCLPRQRKRLLLMGDSLLRMMFRDMLLLADPSLRDTDLDWKSHHQSHGEPPFMIYVGAVPDPQDGTILPNQRLLSGDVDKLRDVQYNRTLSRVKEAFATHLPSGGVHENTCLISLGLYDVWHGTLDKFEHNLVALGRVMENAPCRLVWMRHATVHDANVDREKVMAERASLIRHFSSSKLDAAMEIADNVARKFRWDIFDASWPTAGMSLWSEDGVHYYHSDTMLGNPVSQTVTQLALNIVCNRQITNIDR